MGVKVFLPAGTKEQLQNAGINPPDQDVFYSYNLSKAFPEELYLMGDDRLALLRMKFHPKRTKSNIVDLSKQIIIHDYN